MATRKISDLTLLGAGQVSSSDTLLLLDNSDPTDQNKRSAVGSIFTAVPNGTYTAPGVRFESRTSTGVFSEAQGQVGLSMGNARLSLQKVGTTLNLQARDDADVNLDLNISAQGTGKIRLGSLLAINDLNFTIPNSIDETKVARFSVANLPSGITNVYTFPSNVGLDNASDELLTLKSVQTMENKIIVSPTFTGDLSMGNFTSSGNATLGDDAADSLTVNAAATFASSATFANSVILNQGATITGDVTLNSHLDMVDDKEIKLGTDDDFTIGFFNTADNAIIKNSSTLATAYLALQCKFITLQSETGDNFLQATDQYVKIYHGATGTPTERITTTNTGINIGGAIDAVTSITGSGDIAIATDKFTLDSTTGNAVFGGNITGGGDFNATTGTTFQLGSSSSAKLGIGRAATTYNLEVEGSIYSTGSTIIAGLGSIGKFILQKGVAAIGLHFTDHTGTDQMVLDANGQLGIGKTPAYKLDVSGDSWVDGDITINTTNPSAKTGGKISAREIVLTDTITGTTTTLDSMSGSGVSRARVFFANM